MNEMKLTHTHGDRLKQHKDAAEIVKEVLKMHLSAAALKELNLNPQIYERVAEAVSNHYHEWNAAQLEALGTENVKLSLELEKVIRGQNRPTEPTGAENGPE